jgi:predicted O-methyltransferase YrrM
MLGIKTKLLRFFGTNFSKKITKDFRIRDLMNYFSVDEDGHEAKVKFADLGYGWIHYGLVRQQKPERILCIGSRYGYIPAVLAQACSDNCFGKVDFVDAGYDSNEPGGWTGVGYWRTDKGKNSFKEFGLGKYIFLYLMTTLEFSQKYPSRVYDYIYIDGNHSFRGVSLDFKLFWPRLRKGGKMAFHDICVKGVKPEGKYGVWLFWKKLEKKWGGIRIDYPNSGLGIVQKRQ